MSGPGDTVSGPALTLVVAVYNGVRPLSLILEALRRQSFRPFEVLVADDGSGEEVRALVERAAREAPFPLRHLWQEDRGFRKNAMLNRAIAAARSGYMVFIDGDCVPHREFLRDHFSHRAPKGLLCGRRVNLSRELSDRLTPAHIRSGEFERLSLPLLWDGLKGRSSNLEDGIRIRSPLIRRLLLPGRGGARILGCNFSVEKKYLENINGFNEDYQAAGRGEDSDIAFRLELTGVQLHPLRYLAIVYHLYHPPTMVGEENKRIHEQVMRERNPLCRNGLAKLP